METREQAQAADAPDEITLDEAVERMRRHFGVPKVLVDRLLKQESGGRTDAESYLGAEGIFQVMPGTLETVAKKTGKKLDPSNPIDNAYAGLRLLKNNYDAVKPYAKSERHAWMMSAAGYHGPLENVLRDVRAGGSGIPDQGDGLINTTDYVLRVFEGTRPEDFEPEQKQKQAQEGTQAGGEGNSDDDVVKIDASRSVTPAPQSSMPPLGHSPAPDPYTEEGRAQRDAGRAVEAQPDARKWVDVGLPAGARGWEDYTSNDVAKAGVRQWAAERGIPSEFTEKWLQDNGGSLHIYDLASPEKVLDPKDAMGDPAIYDLNSRTFRLSAEMPPLRKLADDYDYSRGIGRWAADYLTDPETSPGEKVLGMAQAGAETAGDVARVVAATPQGQTARAAYEALGEPAMKGVGALDTYVWAKALGYGDQTAQTLAELHYQGIETPVSNPIGEMAGKVLEPVNPRAASAARTVLGIVAQPTNLLPLPEVGALLKAGRLGRAGEAGGELTQRVARSLAAVDRGLVEHAPLGVESAAEDSLDVFLRGRNGRNFIFNTGSGDLVDLETGELLDINHPDTAKLFDAATEAPHHSTVQPRTEEGKFDGPPSDVGAWFASEVAGRGYTSEAEVKAARQSFLNASREEPDDAGVRARLARVLDESFPPKGEGAATPGGGVGATAGDAAGGGEQPLHEYLSELTGQPTPEIQPAPAPATARGVIGKVAQTASDIINLPKSFKSSFALHGPFRQGVFQAAAHPTFLKDAISAQARAFASEEAFQDFARSIMERPDYILMKESGLFLPSTYDVEFAGRAPLSMREERFASAAAEKIPGVRASGRAYHAAMDSLRIQAWDLYMADLAGESGVNRDTLKALADFINISTGRGQVPILDRFAWGRKAVAAANMPLWSPRAMASRFNVISPYRLATNLANPATRPVALLQLRDSMRAVTTIGATLGLLSLVPGVHVGWSPYTSEWGRVSVGDTHYDVLDGVPATARFVMKLKDSFTREAEGRRVLGYQRPSYIVKDFFRRRLSPSGQAAADFATGHTEEGEPFSYSKAAADLAAPFVVEDMYHAWLDAGGSGVVEALGGGKGFRTGFKGLPKALPSFVGVPTSSYKVRQRRYRGGYGAGSASFGDKGPEGEATAPF